MLIIEDKIILEDFNFWIKYFIVPPKAKHFPTPLHTYEKGGVKSSDRDAHMEVCQRTAACRTTVPVEERNRVAVRRIVNLPFILLMRGIEAQTYDLRVIDGKAVNLRFKIQLNSVSRGNYLLRY